MTLEEYQLWKLAAERLPLAHRVHGLFGFGVDQHYEKHLAEIMIRRSMQLRYSRRLDRIRVYTRTVFRRYRDGLRLIAERAEMGATPMWQVERGFVELSPRSFSARRAVRHVARDRMQSRTRRGLRAPDGGLWGVREFSIGGGKLISPIMKTVWERPALVANTFDDSTEVKGAAGIHACWPAWPHACRDYSAAVYGLVRGYGRTVQGDNGWRAERVIIEALLVRSRDLEKELRRSYPEALVHYIPIDERICIRNDPFERIMLHYSIRMKEEVA